MLSVSVAAIVVVGGAGAGPDESWADAQYAWTTKATRQVCKPFRDVCATENGGATWHGIFNGGTFVFGVVRTSRNAGVVSTGRQKSAQFWTRDNGKHWYETREIGAEFQGSGNYLFWIDFTRVLRQVRPWPPRGTASCSGAWVRNAFETRPSSGGNICSRPPVEAGMRAVVVARLDEGVFSGIATVPGGAIATIGDTDEPQVLIRRLGRNRLIDLPKAGSMTPCGRSYNTQPIVTWPRIAVLGCLGSGAPVGSWTSLDGGASWTVVSG